MSGASAIVRGSSRLPFAAPVPGSVGALPYTPAPPGHLPHASRYRALHFRAARIGESPRLVGAETLVTGDDLASDLRDAGERPA